MKSLYKALEISGQNPPMSLNDEDWAQMQEGLEVIRAEWPRATVSDLVDHIDHVVEVAGIDHVGIASDFGGGGGIEGWDNAAETEAVTSELLSRGYDAKSIAKIWGGNLLRVMEAVEKAAESAH